uniref:Uncharacterized protein n=1 Tax=Glossina pallidipes TaxID=7398 RepID=A0A1A9ZFU2_GLOPL
MILVGDDFMKNYKIFGHLGGIGLTSLMELCTYFFLFLLLAPRGGVSGRPELPKPIVGILFLKIVCRDQHSPPGIKSSSERLTQASHSLKAASDSFSRTEEVRANLHPKPGAGVAQRLQMAESEEMSDIKLPQKSISNNISRVAVCHIWFSQLKCQLSTPGITLDTTKYHTLVGSPANQNLYEAPLLSEFQHSEEKWLQKLLENIQLGEPFSREMRELCQMICCYPYGSKPFCRPGQAA